MAHQLPLHRLAWREQADEQTGHCDQREALELEREQMRRTTGSLNMTFAKFVDVYGAEIKNRLRLNTWQTKKHIIDTKLIPFFGNRRIDEIGAKDVIAWQNELVKYLNQNGNPFSATYLKTVHN
jgi:hypothetical protein